MLILHPTMNPSKGWSACPPLLGARDIVYHDRSGFCSSIGSLMNSIKDAFSPDQMVLIPVTKLALRVLNVGSAFTNKTHFQMSTYGVLRKQSTWSLQNQPERESIGVNGTCDVKNSRLCSKLLSTNMGLPMTSIGQAKERVMCGWPWAYVKRWRWFYKKWPLNLVSNNCSAFRKHLRAHRRVSNASCSVNGLRSTTVSQFSRSII